MVMIAMAVVDMDVAVLDMLAVHLDMVEMMAAVDKPVFDHCRIVD
jgi:hypothetical protein